MFPRSGLSWCPNPTQAQLGGAGPWRFGWRLSFSNAERGTVAGLGGNVSVGRSAPQVASHSLTYCLVSKKGSFPAEGCFQPRVVSGQGLFPARGCFQPGVVSSQGLFPARGCFQPGACDNFEGFVPQ